MLVPPVSVDVVAGAAVAAATSPNITGILEVPVKRAAAWSEVI